VICPLIDDSEKLEAKSVKKEAEKLKKEIFPEFKIGMLHGKMKPRDKEKTMRDFSKGKINLLVATSVVEVGIDVPFATIMMIEGAERFGLAQLHQFRGRIARRGQQGYCFLFSESSSKNAISRLKALMQAKDGFELAEKDLEIRGPGEIYGIRQSGFPDLKIANLTDLILIKEAHKEAKKLFYEDPELSKYYLLRKKIKDFKREVHLE